MNDIQEMAMHHPIDLLDRGVVTGTSTVVSLLGLDLIGIRQLKVVTTLETWLNCAEFLW
ncbi:hypothetical protein EDC14_10034 [Hydrogenispora ethanolica]|jgi:hypothetical protein|uniref:Uncharacterized protein n=1 Tax=Hydrogenispora ethanolica TaxID=1082276 RepID=A0A4R1S7K9_HYDET|nr:hypothetical protein [Hydrogenispora ethanolica]TCL75074.1 hypothetical protein EDC14_10034 [Hydrogenispora ethanolica]